MLKLKHLLNGLLEGLFPERRGLPWDLQVCLLNPVRQQKLFHLPLAHQVLLSASLLHFEERRLSDVEVSRFDHRHHMPEEEREEKRSNMRAVHIGISHQHDLLVAKLRDIELVGTDPRPHRRDEQPDLLMGEDFVVARLLGVDDLSDRKSTRLNSSHGYIS